MRNQILRLVIVTATLLLSGAAVARADVCTRIDEAHDTLAPAERASVLLLLANALERERLHVVDSPCETTYVLSHVRLGETIFVTLDIPDRRLQGTAIGLDDLPNLYSQMARAIRTGSPIGSLRVIDRTNVTRAQDRPSRRLASDRFGYARLGYGAVFGDTAYAVPALGFGYRAEFDAVAMDVSFFNYAFTSSTGYYGAYKNASGGSLLKLAMLHFADRTANASPYIGAGASWGTTNFDDRASYWSGSGLQGELIGGYEVGRASSVKLFVQADATLPFYRVASTTFGYTRAPSGAYLSTSSTNERYAPTLVVSFGMGWQKAR
jgi:hypothetical protein